MKHMKRIMAVAFVLLSVMAIAIPSLAATPATNKPGVNIRTAAKTNAGLVGQVASGTTLEVLSEVKGENHNGTDIWLKVKVIKCAAGSKHNIDGKTGYVNSSYVSGYSIGSSHPSTQAEAFGASGYIQKGSTGNYVSNVQKVLHEELLISSGEIDGKFGSQTESAVKAYQKKHWEDFTDSAGDLAHVDGIVGPDTKASMWKRHKNFLMQYGVK